MRVGLVACGKTKLAHAAPARELYTSTLFRFAKAYCQEHYDLWYVLSAKHGLVHPETVLAPYDQSLADATPQARWRWGFAVAEDLRRLHPTGVSLHAHAGRLYTHPLENANLVLLHPLYGMPIGKRLGWYKRMATIQDASRAPTPS